MVLIQMANSIDKFVTISDFISYLVACAEKASQIAQAIREKSELFSLLIQEKTESQKNTRFAVDFKTLADVLIQETLRYYLDTHFQGIGPNIFGEESNKFTNTLGETVEVQVCAKIEQTCKILADVLDGNIAAASLLANIVHDPPCVKKLLELEAHSGSGNISLPVMELGVWIDPIDSTAEYIAGRTITETGCVSTGGLANVTVLIGGFIRSTGLPFAGALCQPFSSPTTTEPRILWGVHYDKFSVVCNELKEKSSLLTKKKLLIVSNTEQSDILEKLESNGYESISAPGAGYKFLCVLDGLVQAYILSKPQTYKWDSCAPHALLRALGGGVVSFQAALSIAEEVELCSQNCADSNELAQKYASILQRIQLQYNKPTMNVAYGKEWCNSEGLIAYCNSDVLIELIRHLNS